MAKAIKIVKMKQFIGYVCHPSFFLVQGYSILNHITKVHGKSSGGPALEKLASESCINGALKTKHSREIIFVKS